MGNVCCTTGDGLPSPGRKGKDQNKAAVPDVTPVGSFAFNALDRDGDGKVTKEDFGAASALVASAAAEATALDTMDDTAALIAASESASSSSGAVLLISRRTTWVTA